MKLISKEEFEKLSRKEKIVEICKDVLLRIDSNLIKANNSNFFENRNELFDRQSTSTEVQDTLNSKSCEVCAKGGLVCSWIGNFNNTNVEDLFDINQYAHTLPTDLIELFGLQMLDDIELLFEGEFYTWHIDKVDRCIWKFEKDKWSEHINPELTPAGLERFEYIDETENLIRVPLEDIMQHIIDNKGTMTYFEHREY